MHEWAEILQRQWYPNNPLQPASILRHLISPADGRMGPKSLLQCRQEYNVARRIHVVTRIAQPIFEGGAACHTQCMTSCSCTIPPFISLSFIIATPSNYKALPLPKRTTISCAESPRSLNALMSREAFKVGEGEFTAKNRVGVSGAESSGAWLKQNLDLNTGPGTGDMDLREDSLFRRQTSLNGPVSLAQVGTLYQLSASGASSERKESGGWDFCRPECNQPWW